MFGIRNLLRANNQIFKNVAQQRNMSVICTPPRNKVSRGACGKYLMVGSSLALPLALLTSMSDGDHFHHHQEMIFLAGLMVVGWSAIPAWVLVNIKHYRDKQ